MTRVDKGGSRFDFSTTSTVEWYELLSVFSLSVKFFSTSVSNRMISLFSTRAGLFSTWKIV